MNNTLLEETKQVFQAPEWYFKKRNYHVRIRMETIGIFLRGAKCEHILDIGCGDGSISVPLLTRENRLTLLDFSDDMLARARSRIPSGALDRVEIINGEFMGAKLQAETYDVVICLGVLAYVDDLPRFLDKLAMLVKPDGRIILEWTDGYHFVSRALRLYHGLVSVLLKSKLRLARQRGAEIIDGLNRRGFQVVGSYRYCSPLPVVRRLLGDKLNYRIIRTIHGDAEHNRSAWMGEECIYHFLKSSD